MARRRWTVGAGALLVACGARSELYFGESAASPNREAGIAADAVASHGGHDAGADARGDVTVDAGRGAGQDASLDQAVDGAVDACAASFAFAPPVVYDLGPGIIATQLFAYEATSAFDLTVIGYVPPTSPPCQAPCDSWGTTRTLRGDAFYAGTFTLVPPTTADTESSDRWTSGVASDISRSGQTDLVLNRATFGGDPQSFQPAGVDVRLGNSDGTFAPPVAALPRGVTAWSFMLDTIGLNPSAIVASQVASDQTVSLATFTGEADGTLHAASTGPTFTVPADVSGSTVRPVWMQGDFDFNGDMLSDVIAGFNDTTLGGPQATYLQVFLQRADGSFALASTEIGPTMAVTGELSHDGRLDLVTLEPAGVSIRLGVGDGTFDAPQLLGFSPPSPSTSWIPVNYSDFDRDGASDLVLLGSGASPVLAIAHGRGDGTFCPPQVILTGPAAQGCGVAEGSLKGDLFTDILCLTDATVSVLMNAR